MRKAEANAVTVVLVCPGFLQRQMDLSIEGAAFAKERTSRRGNGTNVRICGSYFGWGGYLGEDTGM